MNASLAGRYHVEREVGEGGMAKVYRARDLRHERWVALKVLRPELAEAVGRERFEAEIKTAADLQHSHILPLLDSGTADGLLFYVMPFVDGDTVRERLEQEGPLPVDDVVRIARAVADALDHAHERGIVHRDIKPSNILLGRSDVWVTDFGIAKAIHADAGSRLTRTGHALGTPHYMSPEQASGEGTVDGRTDTYALACLVFEMLTGTPPYTGKSAASIVRQHLVAEPPSAAAYRKSIPSEVDRVLEHALAKTPADRYTRSGELADALTGALRGEGFGRVAGGSSHPRWILAGGFVGLSIAAGAWWLGQRAEPSRAGSGTLPVVAVEDFRNTTGDSSLDYLGEAVGRGVATSLTSLTAVEVRPFGATLDDVDYIVGGSYRRRGEVVEFVTEIRDGRRQRALAAPDPVGAPVSDPLAQLEILGERALAAVSYYESLFGGAAATGRPPPSYEAYLAFERGLRFMFRFSMDSTESYMRRAIELEPTYTEAYLILGAGAFNNQGGVTYRRGGMTGRHAAMDSLAGVMRSTITPWTDADEAVASFLEADARADWQASLSASLRLAELLPAGAFGVGYSGLRANNPTTALRGLESLDPDRGWIREWGPYWSFRLSALHMLERHDEELLLARRATERFPGGTRALAVAEIAAGSAADAMALATSLPMTGDVVLPSFELYAHGHVAAGEILIGRYRDWVAEMDPDRRRFERVAQALLLPLVGAFDEAIAILQEIHGEFPQRIDFEGQLGATLAQRGDTAEAFRIDRRLAEEDASTLRGLPTLWRARIAARAGLRDEAVELLARAFEEGVGPHFAFPRGEAYWHSDPHLNTLVGYPPYDELVRPR